LLQQRPGLRELHLVLEFGKANHVTAARHNPTDGVNITLNSANVRPNLNPGCPADTSIGTVAHWFNASCYSLQAPTTIGNAGRNTIFGPNFRNMDMALLKDTKLTERFTVQFRAEFFNLANHSNYRNPSGAVFTGRRQVTLSSRRTG
jgi:hypothetical protein